MEIILSLSAFLLGFALVFISIPPILKVARAKNLYDSFNKRKIHTQTIPPLGGVAIFIGFCLSAIIAADGYSFSPLKFIIAAVILIFFIGLKDDLLAISPSKKLIVQVSAAILLITLGNIRFTNLHGLLGFGEIHYVTSIIISAVAIVAIMNAFNLIDGIDGLASALGILVTGLLGSWFYLAGHIEYSIMSFALAGSLLGFFIFNVFGGQNKIFMGDSGSLVVGLVVSVIIIEFNEFNINQTLPVAIQSAPSVSFAIIIVPLTDTIRIVGIRLMQKKSPFSPDQNHIHHQLVKIIPNHFAATLLILAFNVLVIGLAMFFCETGMNVNLQFLLIFIIGLFGSFIPGKIVIEKRKKRVKKRRLIQQSKIILKVE